MGARQTTADNDEVRSAMQRETRMSRTSAMKNGKEGYADRCARNIILSSPLPIERVVSYSAFGCGSVFSCKQIVRIKPANVFAQGNRAIS